MNGLIRCRLRISEETTPARLRGGLVETGRFSSSSGIRFHGAGVRAASIRTSSGEAESIPGKHAVGEIKQLRDAGQSRQRNQSREAEGAVHVPKYLDALH
jgi:hypothetical protein